MGAFSSGMKNAVNACVEPLLLGLALITSLVFSTAIHAPYRNPAQISSALNTTTYNPDTNFYRILFIVFGTLALFVLLRYLYRSKYAWLIKVLAVGLFVSAFLFQATPDHLAGFHGPGTLDNFHNGEELSPAHAFLEGASLYDEVFYLRGAGVDAVLPAMGMKLFGSSIGAFMLTNELLFALGLISFLTLLAVLIRNSLAFAAIAAAFYMSAATSIFEIRDIFVWCVLGLLLAAFKIGLTARWRATCLVAVGALCSFTLYVSIDRGVLLVLLSGLLAAAYIVLETDSANSTKFNPARWVKNLQNSGFVAAGLVAGLLLPAAAIGWSSFISFLMMTFKEIPAYAGLLVSQAFPPLLSKEYLIWAPIIIAIAVGYVLIVLYESPARKELNRLVPYTLMFIFGVLCIKVGTNRINIDKMATATAPLYLAVLLILIFAISQIIKWPRQRPRLVPAVMVAALAIIVFAQLIPSRLWHQTNLSRSQLAAFKQLPRTSNDIWITSDTRQVRDYIQQTTATDDYIYAFTSNPIYYYLADRKNPTRFYISWYTDPQPYSAEVLRHLKEHPPKLIIYKEDTWLDAPDGIAMEERIPEVNAWILQNYPNRVQVGNTIILR